MSNEEIDKKILQVRWQVSIIMASLIILCAVVAFVCLVVGAHDFALGFGIWLGFMGLGLLVTWVGDQIVSELKT